MTFKEKVNALNEEYFEHFDLYRNGDILYTDEYMLEKMREYRAKYLAICEEESNNSTCFNRTYYTHTKEMNYKYVII